MWNKRVLGIIINILLNLNTNKTMTRKNKQTTKNPNQPTTNPQRTPPIKTERPPTTNKKNQTKTKQPFKILAIAGSSRTAGSWLSSSLSKCFASI